MQTKINNIATNNSTTKFESKFGMMNIAPIKLSGNYKIVIDENNIFYLDNYNGYRIGLDMSKNILPQIAVFLNDLGKNQNINKIKFGGYRNGSKLNWHIPVYIGNDKKELPKYFVLNRVFNDEITSSVDILNTDNDLLTIIDLDKIGVTKIFNELINNQLYSQNMFYFNWKDEQIKMNGYDIVKQTNTTANFSTLSSQANQTKFENLNNQILNQFSKNNLIFPLFINIEFEFSNLKKYDVKFNNYHGYFSNDNLVDLTSFTDTKMTATILEYTNEPLQFKQERLLEDIETITYSDIVANEVVEIPTNTVPQINLLITHLSSGDKITIYQDVDEIFFEYKVKSSDIKETLDDTMRIISKNILIATSRSVICDYNKATNVYRIKLEVADLFPDDYFVVGTPNIKFYDKTNYFNQIRNTDLRIISSGNIATYVQQEIISNVGVSYVKHNVVKFFYFDNFLIVRLKNMYDEDFQNDTFFDNNITNKKILSVYVDKIAKLKQLVPTRYFGVNSQIQSNVQYEKDKYVSSLIEMFEGKSDEPVINQAFLNAVNLFSSQNNFEDLKQYVLRVTDDSTGISIIDQSNVVQTLDSNNDNSILNICFGEGTTGYLTPNICNFDNKFYLNNGNINYEMETHDPIRFHWFLMKSQTPKYISDNPDDIRNLRYFTDKPKLTSRLLKASKTLSYCETTFLGVKYKIPAKYEGYAFAVYLDFGDTLLPNIKYDMRVDNVEKTIYLVINKYLDFIDLIRGGDINNEPLVDLSFFYCVKDAHNTRSEISLSFKTGGLLVCDDTISVMFNNVITTDWKYFDANSNKWYVCLKKSLFVQTSDLKELVEQNTDMVEFYVYSTIKHEGTEYTFVSMKYTLRNVIEVQDEYLWCEDIQVDFFDTKKFFTTRVMPFQQGMTPDEYNKIDIIDKAQIINSEPFTTGIWNENQVMRSTILVSSENHVFKLLNYDHMFSLKKDYFEFTRSNNYDGNGLKTVEETYFYFPEFPRQDWSFAELFEQFDYNSLDNVTPFSRISLFDRNQLWYLIKDIARFELKFKAQTERQVLNSINELLVSRLQEYSALNPLVITNSTGIEDKFMNIGIFEIDTNPVIWKDVDMIPKATKASRYGGNYSPLLFEITDEIMFQNEISTLKKQYGETMYTLYNKNYMEQGISATGFWNDVQGNVVSTLWSSKDETISFTIPFIPSGTIQNIVDGLKVTVPFEEALINNNNNQSYVEKIDMNVNAWIHENYIIWLLDRVWKLESVTNELGQKLLFDFDDEPKNYVVKLRDYTNYHTVFTTATFNFVRQ